MNAAQLIKKAAKAGYSARALSIALGKDPSYLGSMSRRDAQIAEDIVERATRILRGDDVSAWNYANESLQGERLAALLSTAKDVNAAAEAIGVSPSSIYKWRQGKGNPRSELVAKNLAEHLGVSVDFLYGYGTEPGDEASVANLKAVDKDVSAQRAEVAKNTHRLQQRFVAVILTVEAFDAMEKALKLVDPGLSVREL